MKLFLIVSIFLISWLQADVPLRQKQVLEVFYNDLNGDHWKNNTRWNSGDPCTNQWYGVACDNNNTYIKQIVMVDNNLTGTIPPELKYLSDLDLLVLIENDGISGTIPSELGELQALMGLILMSQNITGEIPVSLGNLPNLITLMLVSQKIRGSIPPQIADDTKLVELVLASEELNGTIPQEIGNLTNLTRLSIRGGGIGGEIPQSFSQLTKLIYFTIDATQITGDIPQWIADIDTLKQLNLTNNRFTGGAYNLLYALSDNASELEVFNLSNNLIRESLPDLLYLPELQKFYIDHNAFYGQVPELRDLDTLNDANGLNLNYNNFSVNNIEEGLVDFIAQKSSDFEDWRKTQNIDAKSMIPVLQYLLF